MIKIAICDDNIEQLRFLEKLTNEYFDENQIVAEVIAFNHSDKLINILEKESFQIYILDIVMPMINGIELGLFIRRFDLDAQIIFATTAPEYALDSFSSHPINYLIKPVRKEQFFETLSLAVSKIDTSDKTITFKTKDGLHVLDFSSVVYVEKTGNTVSFYRQGGETVTSLSIRTSLTDFVAPLLLDRRFIKPHTSFIINMKYVKIITPKEFIMKDDTAIPISDKLYSTVSKAYLDFIFGKVDNND